MVEAESDDSSTDFEIAANPLNSLNPPPKDLPDLLDSLLVSKSDLSNKLQCCDSLAEEIESRLVDLQDRLKSLRSKFPQWRSDNPNRIDGPKDKHRLAFGAQEAVYVRMESQIAFIYSIAHMKLPIAIAKQEVEHKHVFETFLGDLHDHRGVEVANSAHLHCVDGCRWYFEHGPYEWTKKPYTDQWRTEMNYTNWDWVRLREHIEDLTKSTASNHIRVVNDFEKQIRRFIPPWFWNGQTHRWGLQSRFRVVENQNGVKKVHMNVFVTYQKSDREIDQEHAHKLAMLTKQQKQEGVEDQTSIDATSIVVEPVGAFNVNNNTVFDGELFVEDWDKAELTPSGSWLNHWGYDKWVAGRLNTGIRI